MGLKDFADLLASLVPASIRDQFNNSPLARVLFYACMFLVLVVAYLSLCGLVLPFFGFADAEAARAELGNLYYWPLLGAPIVLIFLWLLPGFVRAIRAQRLDRLRITATGNVPGKFRLYPYGPQDKDQFTRTDGADLRALDWLRGTDRTLLYLSGASGTGKSSLIGASLLPTLEAEGWATLTVRIDDAPAAQLFAALRARAELFEKTPGPAIGLRSLLERAAARRAGKPPLLIVIDQFEELLILNDPAARQPVIDFLRSIESDPIPGLCLLCVFRSDYRELLFQLDLPDYRPRANAFELAPFVEKNARAFLDSSGLQLTPESQNKLLRGLDRIEEARGLYRPITLNMVGFVLERSGSHLRDDPERLIESYLRDCLTSGPARDHAASVLGQMITEAGTKEPRDLSGLATATGLPIWQIEAVLTQLELDGLVRRLADGRWEISHDFIARLLGILIGRLRPPLWRRAAPVALPIFAAGWAAAVAIAVIYLPEQQDKRILAEFRKQDILQVTAGSVESLRATNTDLNNNTLAIFAQQFNRLHNPPLALDLSSTGVVDLTPLKDMKLTTLDLSSTRVEDLTPLKDMKLTELYLSGTSVVDLTPLKDMKLTSLNLTGTSVVDLAPLKDMKLTSLNLTGTSVVDLAPLKDMKLTSLNLTGTRVVDLTPLKDMKLTSLDLSNTRVEDLTPLKDMKLTSLDLSNTRVEDLTPLKDMKLTSLDLSNTRVEDLTPLKDMKLTSLDLSDVNGIKSLKPLAGIDPAIIQGASPKLMATLPK